MPRRYQDVYPSPPLLDSAGAARRSAAALLTLEYFEAEAGEMAEDAFDQHHVLLNLRDAPQRVENRRDGVLRDFVFHKDEIVVTPAGMRSGWRWHGTSRCIVVTLEPDALDRFARSEVGVVLTGTQLRDMPQFTDADICQAGVMLRDALAAPGLGSAVLFESLARVFLVKLIRRYGLADGEEAGFTARFTARHYKRVLDHVAAHYAAAVSLDALAAVAGLSPSHFSRVFRQTIGRSPMQFVAAYRVEQAKRRLADPQTSLSEVALACGFADQAHFTRTFKQAEGLTPGAYRAALAGRAPQARQDRSRHPPDRSSRPRGPAA